VLTLTSAN